MVPVPPPQTDKGKGKAKPRQVMEVYITSRPPLPLKRTRVDTNVPSRQPDVDRNSEVEDSQGSVKTKRRRTQSAGRQAGLPDTSQPGPALDLSDRTLEDVWKESVSICTSVWFDHADNLSCHSGCAM